jgi:glycosyltransferase involved in cell wall biosynthesis
MNKDIDSGNMRRALLLVPHDPKLDPRIDWFAEGLIAANFEVCEVGLNPFETQANPPSSERLSANRLRVRLDWQWNRWDFAAPYDKPGTKNSVGVDAIRRLYLTAQLPARPLARAVGEPDVIDADIAYFRELCVHFVRVNSILLEASRRIGGFDLVVAADLYTLPAGVALAQERCIPLIYDAHEYWPYSLPGSKPWQIRYWSELERTLLTHVTLPLTVSPPLAQVMTQHYGRSFGSVPNCAPLGSELAIDLEEALAARAGYEEVVFLVQAGFVPERGFDKLVHAWGKVDPRAKLWLRGPDNALKDSLIELARNTGLLERSVFFPPPVSENDLIKGAREADIGLIPYEPVSINNRFCCPNKLSQYMAAGLPIISNKLDYVMAVVEGNDIGTCVDFENENALVDTINHYVSHSDMIPELSRRSQAVFKTKFNWQHVSHDAYAFMSKAVAELPTQDTGFDLTVLKDIPGFLSPQEEHIRYLNSEVQRLNEVHTRDSAQMQTEIERLNKVYSEHQIVLQQEIERLNKVYPEQIAQLQSENTRTNIAYTAEINRLHHIAIAGGCDRPREGVLVSAYRGVRRAARPLKSAVKALMGTRNDRPSQ